MENIIKELINIKDDYTNRLEEIIYDNINYECSYKDLTTAEISKINNCRKNIRNLYNAINILNEVKESD
jgi:hypothetical protein